VDEASRPVSAMRTALTKVPEVTVLFWVIKVLTTGMGETTSDYLTHRLDPPVAVGIVFLIFAASLVAQFAVRRYLAGVYWFAVVMVSVFGTMAADVLHVGLHIPYAVSTVFYAVVLTIIFVVWYAMEKTLSIHSINTPRREFFYWATVLATFALGTAAGDLTASTFKLGYLTSGVIFAVIIAIPAIAHRAVGMNAIFAFWFAYITTRPLGASFADWMGVPPNRGGLDWGTGPVSIVLGVIIAVLVTVLAVGTRAPRTDPSYATGQGS
jgi:uncharacterized membrane-anchored protein